MPGQPELLLSKPDIAALAKVKRPVVSVWIGRYREGDRPFPTAVRRGAGGREWFRADEIADWLIDRGLGNNTSLREDLALHAALDHSADLSAESMFDGTTALLCLKALLGEQLAEFDPDDLLDEADDLDPDDEFLLSELTALGDELETLARHVDSMADAAYTPAAAFEELMAGRFRRGHADLADSALSRSALRLCAQVCAAMVPDTAVESTVFVDPWDGSDLLVALRGELDESVSVQAATGTESTAAGRLARRRLATHGWHRADGGLGGSSPVMALTQFPSPATLAWTDERILTAIDDLVVQMGPDQRGVIIGPASALIDTLAGRDEEAIRSGLLRTDRLRAAVRLPEGLLLTRPGQAMALWVLGAADPAIKPADRWTVLADLSAGGLDDVAAEALTSDVLAALGTWESVRAHAFRYGAVVKTAEVLASGTLTPPRRPGRAQVRGGQAAGRVLSLVDAVNHARSVEPLRLTVEYRERSTGVLPTAGELSAQSLLRVVPGNRIAERDITSRPDEVGAVPVIGADEVTGAVRLGTRCIDRLTLTRDYPNSRYTEPGDVVFCSSGSFGAIVDEQGSSVVCSPARILRVRRPESSGLVPELIAAHLNSGDGPALCRTPWRQWTIPRVQAGQVRPTRAALAELSRRRREAAALADRLDALTGELTRGIAHGALTPTQMSMKEG
ncbi:hypothetical protein [Speluncibacter jeojiensis]|uniref:DNA methylase adenine-specific domain-containing protein n=1 Tax=Speluncibacter jeojiensis TaxID=2710754 RepID=A0A9X4M0W7_9ACTN|nr:hypothetical protein [Corynebacteriales bacterium D3-21]